MDVSIFLAKLIGLYLVITSLFIIAKRDTFKAVFVDYFNHPALVLVNGVIALILGLLIVLVHNVWEWNYKVLITLFGYLSVLKGIILLFIPEWAHKTSDNLSKGNFYLYEGFIFFLIGIYLTYVGFFGG